jgi:hypothetical protein
MTSVYTTKSPLYDDDHHHHHHHHRRRHHHSHLVGMMVGAVGTPVGTMEGALVGIPDGPKVGLPLGHRVGVIVGDCPGPTTRDPNRVITPPQAHE